MKVDWEEMQNALERIEKSESTSPMLNVIEAYGKDSSEYQSAVVGYEYGIKDKNDKISKHFIKFIDKMLKARTTMDGQQYVGYDLAIKHIIGFAKQELNIEL